MLVNQIFKLNFLWVHVSAAICPGWLLMPIQACSHLLQWPQEHNSGSERRCPVSQVFGFRLHCFRRPCSGPEQGLSNFYFIFKAETRYRLLLLCPKAASKQWKCRRSCCCGRCNILGWDSQPTKTDRLQATCSPQGYLLCGKRAHNFATEASRQNA